MGTQNGFHDTRASDRVKRSDPQPRCTTTKTSVVCASRFSTNRPRGARHGLKWPERRRCSCGRRPSAGRAPYLLLHPCGSSSSCNHRPPGARTCRWKPSLAARRAPGGRRPPGSRVAAAVPGAAGRGGACRGGHVVAATPRRRRSRIHYDGRRGAKSRLGAWFEVSRVLHRASFSASLPVAHFAAVIALNLGRRALLQHLGCHWSIGQDFASVFDTLAAFR